MILSLLQPVKLQSFSILRFLFRRFNSPSPKSVQLESIFSWNGSSKSERTCTFGIYLSFCFTTYNKFSQGNRHRILSRQSGDFQASYRTSCPGTVINHRNHFNTKVQLRHAFKWIQMPDRPVKNSLSMLISIGIIHQCFTNPDSGPNPK